VVAGGGFLSRERGVAQIAIVGALVLAVVGVGIAAVIVGPPAPRAEPEPPMFASIAPAIPTADLEAQSAARNTVAAALTAYTDHATFRGVSVEELHQIEPSLAFTSDASLDAADPSVAFTPQTVGIAVRSGTGSCFWIRVTARGRTAYGEGEPCTGTAAFGATERTWS